MKNRMIGIALTSFAGLLFSCSVPAQTRLDSLLPVRGFCIDAPRPVGLDSFLQFINQELAPPTLDAQVTYLIESAKLQIKMGATNLANHYYRSFLGGPEIGAMYYMTLTYGINRMVVK